MPTKNIKMVAEKMKQLDFCQMITVDGRGTHHSRPMSNNRNVEFDGTTYFFSFGDSGKVRQLEQNPLVSLTFQTEDMLFIHLYGKVSIIKQRGRMEEFWDKSLDRWFPQGLDTPDVVMLKVNCTKVAFWHKEEEGIIHL